MQAVTRKKSGYAEHLSRKTKPKWTKYVNQDWAESDAESPKNEEWSMFTRHMFTEGSPEAGISLNVQVNGVTLAMELDTGASVTIMFEMLWQEKLHHVTATVNRYPSSYPHR